jgi:hypothetical protein
MWIAHGLGCIWGTMAQPGPHGHAIVLANVTPTRQAQGRMIKARRHMGGAMKPVMKSSGMLLIAVSAATLAVILALAGPVGAQTAQSTEPIEVAKFPYIEIFSPTFFWSDEADFVRTGSTTCPKGRAITGGLSIQQGKASLRVLESYPDGESWVMRVVNRQKPDNVQSLQVRGFALCMLPAARRASVLFSQQTKLSHVSSRFGLPSGFVSTASRQACPQGSLVISGGFGLDPEYRGPAAPRVELSYPDPNGWNVRAVNGATATPADARAYAVCLGSKEGADIRNFQNIYYVGKDVLVKTDNGEAKEAVSCGGEGAYVLAGGARTVKGRSANIEMQESFPDTPGSWTVAVTNRGDKKAADATVKLYAVCIKK